MNAEREILLKLIRASVIGDTGFVIPDSLDWSAMIDESKRQSVSVIASDGLQNIGIACADSDTLLSVNLREVKHNYALIQSKFADFKFSHRF